MTKKISRRHFNMTAVGGAAWLYGSAIAPAIAGGGPQADRAAWEALRKAVGGRLIEPTSPWKAIAGKPLADTIKNPFYLESVPGVTQTTGWLDAWDSRPSAYAVAAESTADIVAAVNFARENNVHLAVKGTGHDYLGRSSSHELLLWTHNMRKIETDQAFVPQGAPAGTPGVPALSAQAGARWLEAFGAATKAGMYVQGGGCTSVGVCGGFIQGSGFGPFSKRYGSGASGVLEFEVVTADGKVLIVNEYQHPDLFWAMRGGGGGTFGIVSRITLMSHPMPKTVGILTGGIKAHSDAAYKKLIQAFIDFYPKALDNPDWGESVALSPKNELGFRLTFLDKSKEEGEAILAPFLDPLRASPADYTVEPNLIVIPFSDLWNPDYWNKAGDDFITMDPLPDAPKGRFWWTGNQNEVSWFLNAYESRWMPTAKLLGADAAKTAEAFFQASRLHGFIFQINKGLSGEAPEAAARDRKTALHPSALTAAGLVIMVSGQQHKHRGILGHEPDLTKGRASLATVKKAMKFIEDIAPEGGAYANEADFHQPNWQDAFWGSNYPKLLAVKRKYDPDNLFRVHHGVGSE